MRRFRCPKCKTEFQGTLENCPKCGIRLHYQNEETKKEVIKVTPKQTFFFDDDRVNKKGIRDDYEILKENSDVVITHIEDKSKTPSRKDDFPTDEKSYFDGMLIQKIGILILATLLTVFTLFIGFPAAMCMVLRWEYRHTVIMGHRLDFDGKGSQLFGRYLLWLFLTIITFGIFLYWLTINVKKWKTKHIIFMKEE